MQLWQNFLLLLDSKMGKKTVDIWVRPLKVIRFDACNLYLEAEDAIQSLWVEEHVLPFAAKNFINNNSHAIKIHISSPDQVEKEKATPAAEIPLSFESDHLFPHCNFDQYVPTTTNRNPTQIFMNLLNHTEDKLNPIYIYGPSGSGKTHLLMAACAFYRQKKMKVFYVHAETFTEHTVSAIRSSNMQSFRAAYRGIDVLIIDDIGAFGRKAATQEELFHTFNTLHIGKKQIILSANVNPSLLEYIEARLISRFEWGITLPLEKPTETAILPEILAKRSAFYKITLKKQLQEYLIKNFPTPGALSRALETLIEGNHHPHRIIELNHAAPLLERLIDQENKNSLSPEKILESVANAFGIKKEDILSKSQSRESTLPRQIAMYLLRGQLKLPYMKIGDIFKRDHSTVMSSIKQITQGLEAGHPEITHYLNQLRRSF